jgi:hypothetical protein
MLLIWRFLLVVISLQTPYSWTLKQRLVTAIVIVHQYHLLSSLTLKEVFLLQSLGAKPGYTLRRARPPPLIDPCLGSDEHFQTATAGTYFPQSRHTYPQLMRSCGSLLAFLRATCMISGAFVNAEGTFSLRWQPGMNPVLDFCGPSRNRTSTQWQELSTYS